MTYELKPCPAPWCRSTRIDQVILDSGQWAYECSNCGICCPAQESEEEARAGWNNRPGGRVVAERWMIWAKGSEEPLSGTYSCTENEMYALTRKLGDGYMYGRVKIVDDE